MLYKTSRLRGCLRVYLSSIERVVTDFYRVGHLLWDLGWVDSDLGDPHCCLAAHPILPNCHLPGIGQTMKHPVLFAKKFSLKTEVKVEHIGMSAVCNLFQSWSFHGGLFDITLRLIKGIYRKLILRTERAAFLRKETRNPYEIEIQSRPLVWSTDVRSTRLYGQFLLVKKTAWRSEKPACMVNFVALWLEKWLYLGEIGQIFPNSF